MAEHRTQSSLLRFSVFERDKFTCRYCGSHPPDVRLHLDHIIPISKVGANSAENLITSCSSCNYGKANNVMTSLPAHLTAAMKVPITRRMRTCRPQGTSRGSPRTIYIRSEDTPLWNEAMILLQNDGKNMSIFCCDVVRDYVKEENARQAHTARGSDHG